MQDEQERQRDMRQRRERGETIWWAGAFLWAGLILLLDNAEALPQVDGVDAWSWIFAGAGLWALSLDIYAVLQPKESTPTAWDWTWAGILLILGLTGFLGVEIAFPLILLLVGGVLLLRVALKRDQPG